MAKKTILYGCSGCSDVGELADQTVRRLTREGAGQMACLAGLATGATHFRNIAIGADAIRVIDGCPLSCASKLVREAGFEPEKVCQLANHGLRKGESPVNPATLEAAWQAAVLDFMM